MSEEKNEYRNKSVINQRGATMEINNSTDREEIKISQYSGSNLTLNNIVNSELATNNKQVKVNNDFFETVSNDRSSFVGNDKVERVVQDSYSIKGFASPSQLEQYDEWKKEYGEIAIKNSFFKIQRGGVGFPGGAVTLQQGSRDKNSTLNQQTPVVENAFSGYGPTPKRTSSNDEVVKYIPVPDRGKTKPASKKAPKPLEDAAKGNVSYPAGPEKNSATEGGTWDPTPEAQDIPEALKKKQDILNPIEQQMGNGGNDISFVKRHKIETIGATNNNYPTIRVDPNGRSHPIEMTVGDNVTFTGVGSLPHVEEIDNDMNFPAGDYTLNVGNKYNVFVGSGGIQFKTSGAVEIGGTTCKVAANKINIQGSSGVSITSEGFVELQSINSISLRSNKQVFIEPGLGVKNNLIVGGGLYVEGEVYVHHITAPVEIQETQDTTLYGKFNCTSDRTLLIGETLVGGAWYPTYAKATDDLIYNYPHSHHFANIPIRLMTANQDVRQIAQREQINKNGVKTYAIEQIHERKL